MYVLQCKNCKSLNLELLEMIDSRRLGIACNDCGELIEITGGNVFKASSSETDPLLTAFINDGIVENEAAEPQQEKTPPYIFGPERTKQNQG